MNMEQIELHFVAINVAFGFLIWKHFYFCYFIYKLDVKYTGNKHNNATLMLSPMRSEMNNNKIEKLSYTSDQ